MGVEEGEEEQIAGNAWRVARGGRPRLHPVMAPVAILLLPGFHSQQCILMSLSVDVHLGFASACFDVKVCPC